MRSALGHQADTCSLLREGETCWRTSTATRATLLIDGAEYFAVLRQALLQAREQILIAGWDFDSRILLPRAPGEEPGEAPLQLGEFLGYLVRTRPGLQIHVARWAYHWMYYADREPDTREQLTRHGVRFYEYSDHPWAACVHHKIVVIDDALAFCGGIDLTHHRWDTSEHAPGERRRIDTSGASYMPVHDTQLCVAGPVATHLGEYLRAGWPAPAVLAPRTMPAQLWPEGLRIEFENIRTGISRTVPASSDSPAAREIEAWYLAAIGATERCLYLENQYFTNPRIARAILERCTRATHIEGVLVGMDAPKTPAELHTMGYGLRRFRKLLAEGEVEDRVPLMTALSADGRCINMHSKLAIFDDRWLTAGSANLNRRSMGLDVECNLVLEATTTEHRRQIEQLRTRLLAEHSGIDPQMLASQVARHGAVGAVALASGSRRLERFRRLPREPVLGPMLAPLFDRDDIFIPDALRARRWQFALPLERLLPRRNSYEDRASCAAHRERSAQAVRRHGTRGVLLDRGIGATRS
jgi:phospholipase D1/2